MTTEIINNAISSVGSIYYEGHYHVPYPGQPEERVVGKDYSIHCGGGAVYLARTCHDLGMNAEFFGKVGKDTYGQILHDMLIDDGITPVLLQSNDYQTNIGIIFHYDDGRTQTNVFGNANPSLTRDELINAGLFGHNNPQYLYFGGCFRMESLLPHYEELIQDAHRRGVLVGMDHGPVGNNVTPAFLDQMKQAIRIVDFYFPSKNELLKLWGYETVEQALRELHDLTAAQIIVKDSINGAFTFEHGKLAHVEAIPVANLVSTVGAGDNFNAGYLVGHNKGLPTIECMQWGTATAHLHVSGERPTVVRIQQLISSGAC